MMWMSECRDDGPSGRGDQATRELPPSRQKSDGGSLPTSRHNSRPPTRSGSRPSTDDSLRHGIGGPVFRSFGWCVCNSSNTLPTLEKLALYLWDSLTSLPPGPHLLVLHPVDFLWSVSTWRGGFVIFSGTMTRWSSLSRTTCVLFWPKRSFQCDMRRCHTVSTQVFGA